MAADAATERRRDLWQAYVTARETWRDACRDTTQALRTDAYWALRATEKRALVAKRAAWTAYVMAGGDVLAESAVAS